MLTKCKMKCFRMWRKYEVNSALILSQNQPRRNLYGLENLSTGAMHFPIGLCGKFHRLCTFAAGIVHECSFFPKVVCNCGSILFFTLNSAGRIEWLHEASQSHAWHEERLRSSSQWRHENILSILPTSRAHLSLLMQRDFLGCANISVL